MPADDLYGASALLAGLPDRQGFGDATLIKLREGSVDLGGGNPDPDLLPTDLYRDAVREVTESARFANSLRYTPAAGIDSLREFLAAREGVGRDRVIVTSGGIHGLALAALGTVDPGDVVLVDDPIFPLFPRVLDLVGATIESVPVTGDGIDVEVLADKLRAGLRPAALFTVPTFQNPTGAVLSEERAGRLAELAEHYGFTIYLDDPYREIGFPGYTAPDHSVLRASDRVIGVNTFSKTLGPALRLGWVVVPESLSPQFVKLRNRLDGQASGVLQEIVLSIISRPEYADRIAAAGAAYEEKSRVLRDVLAKEFGDALELDEAHGGFFLWGRLRDTTLDSQRLFDLAQEGGVTYQRGEWFAADPATDLTGHVRLSFSEPSRADLRLGAERLADAWRTLRG